MFTHVFVMKSHNGLRFGEEGIYFQHPMFTCEKCHRDKPDQECVHLHGGVSFVIGLMVPPAVSVVCRRCSQRVKRMGFVALAGVVVISVITVLVLDFASDYF
jgi:hypothetical protein